MSSVALPLFTLAVLIAIVMVIVVPPTHLPWTNESRAVRNSEEQTGLRCSDPVRLPGVTAEGKSQSVNWSVKCQKTDGTYEDVKVSI